MSSTALSGSYGSQIIANHHHRSTFAPQSGIRAQTILGFLGRPFGEPSFYNLTNFVVVHLLYLVIISPCTSHSAPCSSSSRMDLIQIILLLASHISLHLTSFVFFCIPSLTHFFSFSFYRNRPNHPVHGFQARSPTIKRSASWPLPPP